MDKIRKIAHRRSEEVYRIENVNKEVNGTEKRRKLKSVKDKKSVHRWKLTACHLLVVNTCFPYL